MGEIKKSSLPVVESTVPIKAIKSAVAVQHSHENKELLDSLTDTGSPENYLGEDGLYHEVPALFDTDAFLESFNQEDGNVKGSKDGEGKLILNTENTFAEETDDKVVGSVGFSQVSVKQVDVEITKVDVNTGDTSEADLKAIKATSGVTVGFDGEALTVGLATTEAPFINKMDKKPTAVAEKIAVFGSGGDVGQVVEGLKAITDLATKQEFDDHAADEEIHVTQAKQDTWDAKQDAFNPIQMQAVNSGITSTKVAEFDALKTTKQSIAGNTPSQNVVTDASGNIVTESKPDLTVKMDKVPTAVQHRVATFNPVGQVQDSNITLGVFSPFTTVREYIDTAIISNIGGSSYQGTFTFFGTIAMVEMASEAQDGDIAIAFDGSYTATQVIFTELFRGDRVDGDWEWNPVSPAPAGGAWFEVDNMLMTSPVVSGRGIVKMDGINPTAIDIRPSTSIPFDDVTIGLDSNGYLSFKLKTLGSGKQVLGATTSDQIVYEFTSESGSDTSKTIKEVVDDKIGDDDPRLSDARPSSDVSAWAKSPTKPTYAVEDITGLQDALDSKAPQATTYTKTEVDNAIFVAIGEILEGSS